MVIRIAVAAMLLAIPAAKAGPIDDCNQELDAALRIRGCTAVLSSGTLAMENLSMAYTNRGVAHASMGKSKRALADFDHAIALDADNWHAVYNRANALFDAGRYLEAVAGYSKAIKLNPSLAYAFLNRGLSQERLNQPEQAAKDYSAALELDSSLEAASKRLKLLGRQAG